MIKTKKRKTAKDTVSFVETGLTPKPRTKFTSHFKGKKIGQCVTFVVTDRKDNSIRASLYQAAAYAGFKCRIEKVSEEDPKFKPGMFRCFLIGAR